MSKYTKLISRMDDVLHSAGASSVLLATSASIATTGDGEKRGISANGWVFLFRDHPDFRPDELPLLARTAIAAHYGYAPAVEVMNEVDGPVVNSCGEQIWPPKEKPSGTQG